MFPRLLALALLLAPWLRLAAAEAAKPAQPMVFAAHYCWYHDGKHPQRPFLHWTYPSSETNALAKKAQKPATSSSSTAGREARIQTGALPAVGWSDLLALSISSCD